MTDTKEPTRRELVNKHVATRVSRLQSQLLERDGGGRSTAGGQLARLRRVDANDPGDPRAWELTFEGISPRLTSGPGSDTGPTNAERAIHAAFVLFAIHTQSATRNRHVSGRRLGLAVRELVGDDSTEGPVARRFQAFATASTWRQRLYHLRGLVTLMRSHDIPLDYGSLAVDLYDIQTPQGLARTRLQWGRDFHFLKTPSPDPTAGPTPQGAATQNEEN